MCGRYTLTSPAEAVGALFRLGPTPALAPRYNIAPSQMVPAVRLADGDGRVLSPLKWGLIPGWAKDEAIGHRLINARAETVADKPAFRNAFRRRRCLIAADGFYEWQKTAPAGGRGGGARRGKQPYWIARKDRAPFAFAGLWERWAGADGAVVESCTILTCPPNALMAPIHNRMPVILAAAAHDTWLDPAAVPADLAALLASYPDELLAARAVSTHVNDPRHDDADCIAALLV